MTEHDDFLASVRRILQDKKWAEFKEFFKENASDAAHGAIRCDLVLETFDNNTPPMAWITVLIQKLSLPNVGELPLLVSQIQNFITKANRAHMFVDKYLEIMHTFTRMVIKQNMAIKGVALLKLALTTFQSKRTELSSLHADFLELCLAAKCFRPAMSVLQHDIRTVHSENGSYKVRSFILFYYYGALVHLAVKNYEQAAFFLQILLTTPAAVVSHIMLEGFKKFQLVSLLVEGKVPSLPKYTSPVVTRYMQTQSQPYIEMVTAYSKHDPDLLRAVANKHQAVFQRDNNFGLVKQVINSITKKKILKLTKTFLTLSLSDLVSRVNLGSIEEAEMYLFDMLEEDELHCSIDEQEGMVTFYDDPDSTTSTAILKRIEQQMDSCIELNEELARMDKELKTSTLYVTKVINQSGGHALDESSKMDDIFS